MTEQLIKHYPEKEVGGISGWYWPSMDIQTWGFIKGDWEDSHRKTITALINTYGKTFDTAIQAGGNCGMYPRLLGNMFKKVYTFEPDPINFTCLTMNTFVPNIFKQQAALGEKGSFAKVVQRTMANVGMHQVVENPEADCPMVALDDIPYTGVDLLWLDIEEYEIHALKGAKNTIDRNQPIVMCENATPTIDAYMLSTHNYKRIGDSFMDGIYYIDK